jgi:hypothetical protein
LIVLIDTSGSMGSRSKDVSDAASAAIKLVAEKCPTDLRITWLGVDDNPSGLGYIPTYGSWPSSNFAQTHEQYLFALHGAVPFFGETGPQGFPVSEQGADAIADLSHLFDWRKGACRTIFYISDTTLDGDYSQLPSDSAAVQNAINYALANQVTVFAHYVEGHVSNNDLLTKTDYYNLCKQTGGQAMLTQTASASLYAKLLLEAICNACGNKCETVEYPDIQPCISVAWGDGDCDCLETDDYEVLYVTVCNCFSNVTFANFSIGQLTVTNADGTPVAILPDGTDSVEVRPRGPICFGNIGPCVDGKPSCKSREFVLYTRGAKQGKYNLHFDGVCFDILYGVSTSSCFEFELCFS